MEFKHIQIEEYRQSRANGLTQNAESVLKSFVRLSRIQPEETIEETIARQLMGKSETSCKQQNSTLKGFIEFATNMTATETTTLTFEPNGNHAPKREKTFLEKRSDFGKSVYELVSRIQKMQKNSDLNKNVSFYIREGKQLLTLYGKTETDHLMSEKMLLQTVADRFAEKQTDVSSVKGIIKELFPNPSEEKHTYPRGALMDMILETAKVSENTNEKISKISKTVCEDSFVKSNPKYTFLANEYEILSALLMQNQNLFITGSAGLGKSTMLQQFAYEEKLIYIRVGCDYESDPSELYFTPSFEENRVIYHVQSIGQAFILANVYGGAIIELGELNSANEATMIALHSATDDIKSLDTVIQKIGLHEGVKVLIVGTGNIGYRGTRPLTQALASRMIPFEKQEPSKEFVLEKIWDC